MGRTHLDGWVAVVSPWKIWIGTGPNLPMLVAPVATTTTTITTTAATTTTTITTTTTMRQKGT